MSAAAAHRLLTAAELLALPVGAQQPKLRGQVLSGEAGCRLRRDPDTVVGVIVVVISADLAA